MSEQIQTHIQARYKIVKKIGSGAYGHVYKVTDRKTKKTKALKKNFDAFNNSTDAQRTYREIMFLMELKHPNIIVLQDVIPAQNGKDIYLVFQHMDADLHLLIRQNILAEKHKKYILYQAAKAVLFLHSAGLIHRDLKPSNILVNQSCEAKLCDFGLVRSVYDKNSDNFDILTEYIATRWYRAPQILLGSKAYSKGIDIWGFGCLAAEMIKGKPIFPGTSTINQLEKVLMWTGPPSQSDIQSLKTSTGKDIFDVVAKCKKANRKQYFNQIDLQCLDLIQRCLEFNPDKRITIQQIVTHPYLSQFYDQSQILKSSKKLKIGIDDNRRLSLRDYRALIYDQLRKKNKSSQSFNISLNNAVPQDSTLYRIRQKPKKTIRTQQSQLTAKQALIKQLMPKKSSVNYEHESRTVHIKKQTQNLKKKTFYKAQSLQNKHLKTVDQQEQKLAQKLGQKNIFRQHSRDKDRMKKQKQRQLLSQARKTTLFKQTNNNSVIRNLNRVKRAVTQGDSRKQSKLLTAYIDGSNFYRK